MYVFLNFFSDQPDPSRLLRRWVPGGSGWQQEQGGGGKDWATEREGEGE